MLLKHSRFILISGMLVSIILGGCRVVPSDNATPTPTLVSPGGVISGVAHVESVEIVMRESFPVQISAMAIGSLPDSCTTLDQVIQERKEKTFHITLSTVRPADEACAAATIPFQKAIEIEAVGLEAGTYAVLVNGVQAGFEIQVDNILPESQDPAADAKGPTTNPSDPASGYPVPPPPPESQSPPGEGGYPAP
jgi:hypothetical protein